MYLTPESHKKVTMFLDPPYFIELSTAEQTFKPEELPINFFFYFIFHFIIYFLFFIFYLFLFNPQTVLHILTFFFFEFKKFSYSFSLFTKKWHILIAATSVIMNESSIEE
jgi:hypothetical protein